MDHPSFDPNPKLPSSVRRAGLAGDPPRASMVPGAARWARYFRI